jgi:hypothetical protein
MLLSAAVLQFIAVISHYLGNSDQERTSDIDDFFGEILL